MRCDCIKSDVCPYRREIERAVHQIINDSVGPYTERLESVAQVVRQVCRFRVEGDETEVA